MANVHEWLENVPQPSYAPTSPPFMAPPLPYLEPMDGIIAEDDPLDQITLLDIDENGNTYFDMPNAWHPLVGQPQTNNGTTPIDPSLRIGTEILAPTTTDDSIVTVPKEFAETSRKILVYLAQVIEIPESVEESIENADFTAEELEVLEPIAEEDLDIPIPRVIDGIFVNLNPPTAEIEDIIDDRRVGPDRLTFYLARSVNGSYYWFHSPSADRDRHLRKLIGDYRHKSRAEAASKKAREAKQLRSGRTVGM